LFSSKNSLTLAQLKAGESFAELAAKHSQDTDSKDKGGDLGFFAMGVMVPEFEAKVFAMKEGEAIKSTFTFCGSRKACLFSSKNSLTLSGSTFTSSI
jgi:parvulin-like peptidyl-prolyl isomerase